MEKQYIITVKDGVTKIQFLTNPPYDLLIEIIDELVEKDIYERRLWDLSKIDFDWTVEQLQALAEYGKKVFKKPNKLAFYVTKNLAFGEMRQFEVYRKEDGHSLPMVFRDEEEAIEWLKS